MDDTKAAPLDPKLIAEVRDRLAASGIAVPAERLQAFATSLRELRIALEPLRRHVAATSVRAVFGGIDGHE